MTRRIMLSFAVLVGLLAHATTGSAAIFRVLITDTAFIPEEVWSVRGDTLRWVNQTAGAQTVTTGELCEPIGPLDLPDIAPGDSVSYVVLFGGTGEMYTYFSRHNCPGPHATLVVGPDLPVLSTTWGKIRKLFQ